MVRVRRVHQTRRRRPRSGRGTGVRTGRAALLASAYRVDEHQVQAAVFTWAMWRGRTNVPALGRLLAVPNGGLRAKATAGKLRAEGVRAGVPDLVLPLACRGFHGLWLEVKRLDGTLDPDQIDWLRYLASAGYCAGAGWGVDALHYALSWYVGAAHELEQIVVPVTVQLVDGYHEWRPVGMA